MPATVYRFLVLMTGSVGKLENCMRIIPEMIHPELRKVGTLLQKTPDSMTTAKMKRAALLYPFVRKLSARHLFTTQIQIPSKQILEETKSGILPSPGSAAQKIRIRVIGPENSRSIRGVLVWVHGGGFSMGYPEQNGRFLKGLADRHGLLVLSPDYRLSIDAPYPAALNDVYATLEEAERIRLQLEQKRGARLPLILGGESAGGNLAAACAILARDRKEIHVDLLIPLYPMLDDRMQTESMKDNDGPVWNETKNREAWELYLKGQDPDAINPYMAPGRLEDFSSLPPAISYVGSIDPFRDETSEWFEKLNEAGVRSALRIIDGCFHGFDILFPFVSPARKARLFLEGQIEWFLKDFKKSEQ